jgi:hypothetical protein
MRLGHGQRRAVTILWTWTALLSGLVLYPTYTKKGNDVIPIAVLGLGVALYTLFAPGGRNPEGIGRDRSSSDRRGRASLPDAGRR